MKTNSDYLIIGAGVAGLTAANSIRSLDKASSIILINGEAYPPYKRTKLSSSLAAGFAPDDFTLATQEDLQQFYRIELVEDTISQVNYKEKLAISPNAQYHYEYLILATGARYELPPALQHAKLKFYHNKQETFALQERLKELKHIAVLGGGVQGMETCYELLKLGKHVHLIDPHETPLARLKSPYISAYLKHDLEYRGVQCHWQQRITQFSGSILNDFDLTICCFGTKPITDLFPDNARLQDNLLIAPKVFACGDNWIYQTSDRTFDAGRCTLWHEAMALGQLAGLNAAKLARGTAIEDLAKLERKTYRTKIEVADKILFLAPPIESTQRLGVKHFLLPNANYYQFFLNQHSQLLGASLLCDDRDWLKPLQQAVWDQLDCRRAGTSLNIPEGCEFDGLFSSSFISAE